MTPADLGSLAASLTRPSAAIELAVLAGCLLLAAFAVWAARRRPRPGSVWFGDRIVDGVLFPALALGFVFVARRLLDGTLPIALLKLALPLLLSLLAIRLTARVLRVAFPESAWVRLVERTVSWLVWIGVVLWLTGILPVLLDELEQIRWKIGSTQVSLRNLIEGALSAVVVMVLALWVSAAIEARLLRNTGVDMSLRKIAANATRAALVLVGLMLALTAAGLDLTVLSVFGGALGVGIGFGLQKLAANYISGFVILAERSMRIGDMVKVDNFEGRITDISTRYTVVRALSGREAIVPNEMLITQRVENSSLADRNVLLTTSVTVAYGSDLDALFPALLDATRAVPRVLAAPAPSLQLTEFAADGLALAVLFWIADPENGTGSARSDVNLALLRTLDRLGVEIPYPQRVVRQLGAAAPP